MDKDAPIIFDDVLGLIGGMGIFQWGIFIVLLLSAAWGVESIYMVFVGEYFMEFDIFCGESKTDNVSPMIIRLIGVSVLFIPSVCETF